MIALGIFRKKAKSANVDSSKLEMRSKEIEITNESNLSEQSDTFERARQIYSRARLHRRYRASGAIV